MCFKNFKNCFVIYMECQMKQIHAIESSVWKIRQNDIICHQQRMIWPNIYVRIIKYVWKRALETNLDIPFPTGHGWERKDDQLSSLWMKNQPAPASLLELLICSHSKSTRTNSCQCRVLSVERADVLNAESFAETFMVKSKVIMLGLKRTMKMRMLTTMFRIFDADYDKLCLIAWFILVI